MGNFIYLHEFLCKKGYSEVHASEQPFSYKLILGVRRFAAIIKQINKIIVPAT